MTWPRVTTLICGSLFSTAQNSEEEDLNKVCRLIYKSLQCAKEVKKKWSWKKYNSSDLGSVWEVIKMSGAQDPFTHLQIRTSRTIVQLSKSVPKCCSQDHTNQDQPGHYRNQRALTPRQCQGFEGSGWSMTVLTASIQVFVLYSG